MHSESMSVSEVFLHPLPQKERSGCSQAGCALLAHPPQNNYPSFELLPAAR